jgi:hypothetical protein
MRLAIGLVCAAALLADAGASYAVTFSGGTYLQDFNGLPTTGSTTIIGIGPHAINGVLGTTGLDDWTMSNHAGTSTNTEFRAQDGSLAGSAGRGVVSFGTTAATDRALGTLATSNQISRFGLALTNTSGATLTSFSLSYTGEQWRRGEPDVQNNLFFAYGIVGPMGDDINDEAIFTAVPALSYSSPNQDMGAGMTEIALDGNAAANQVAVSGTVSNLNWTDGSTLLLRWSGQDVTGQDDGLAIDDLSFTAVPEPATWAIAFIAAMGAMLVRRR